MPGTNKLVIVESPAKAKTIAKYLGDDYTVMASIGHIRDLIDPKNLPPEEKKKKGSLSKFSIDIENDFEPYYAISAGKSKTVSELKKALTEADELYLATDEDREGEAIAWHLLQVLKPKVPVKRMVFQKLSRKPEMLTRTWFKLRKPEEWLTVSTATRFHRFYGARSIAVLAREEFSRRR
jgi:DNA topoisomerase I